jgi:hypothetical protein
MSGYCDQCRLIPCYCEELKRSVSFECTPEQYHAGLDILWRAIGNPPMNDEDVYHRVAKYIDQQQAQIDGLRNGTNTTYEQLSALHEDAVKMIDQVKLDLQIMTESRDDWQTNYNTLADSNAHLRSVLKKIEDVCENGIVSGKVQKTAAIAKKG